jgi:4-amino-4-deoxy-L-arabinose transferase-like glycosyltransferase
LTSDEPQTIRDRYLFPVLLLAALAYRLYALTGDMLYDPIIYAQNAYNLLQGTFTLKTDSWYAHRLPVFLPVAPCYALLGVGSLSSRLWPILASLGQVALLLHFGKRLTGRGTAVLAALFAALAPLDVAGAATLQPDLIMAFFLTAAAFLWIRALEGPDQGGGRRAAVLSGLCFALAVLSRENASVLILFYLGTALWRRTRCSALLWATLGGLLVALPLLIFYTAQTGDPFFRFHVTAATYGLPMMQEGARLSFYPSLLFHPRHGAAGLFAPLFILGLAAALLHPDRRRIWLLLWVLPLLLYLEFGSMSLTRYLPVLKRERFLTPLTVPLSLLAASFCLAVLAWILPRLFPRWGPARQAIARNLLLAGLVLVLGANSWSIVSAQRTRGRQNAQAFRSVVAVLRQSPDVPVLFDHWRTGYRFSYYLDFKEGADLYRGGDDRRRMGHPGSFGSSRLGYLSWYPDSTQVPRALIVLDDEALDEVSRARAGNGTYAPGDIPAYAYHPPDSWRLLGRWGGFRVYRRGE